MSTTFNHSAPGLVAGTTRTLLYGPISTGVTAVVFAGLFTNIDSTTLANHWFTLETYNGTTYTVKLNQIPVPYGSASECPKIVLLAGESLYVTADAAASIEASVEVLLIQ